MTYEVQTWDADEYCVNYHTVKDAIDYEDARDVVQSQYPDQKVIAVIKKKKKMTYDDLYCHVLNYINMPVDDKRRACLILGAFMEFIMDCDDAGIVVRDIDMTDFVSEKLDELEAK